MQAGTIEDILSIVPDEFLGEARTWIQEIETTIERVKADVQSVFEQAPKQSRKEFAMWVNQNHRPIGSYLFAMMDGHDIEALIYRNHDWQYEDEE